MGASGPRVESGGFRCVGKGTVSLVHKNAVGLPVGLFVVKFDVIVDMRVDGKEVSESVIVEIAKSQTPPAAPGRLQSDPAGTSLDGDETTPQVSKQRKGFALKGGDNQIR